MSIQIVLESLLKVFIPVDNVLKEKLCLQVPKSHYEMYNKLSPYYYVFLLFT